MTTKHPLIPQGPLVKSVEVPDAAHTTQTLRKIVLVIVLLVVVAAGYLAATQPRLVALVYRELQKPWLPEELGSAVYLQDTGTTTMKVRTQGPVAFRTDEFGGFLVSMDARNAYAEILRTTEGYAVRTAREVVYTDVRPLKGVGRSPDGRYIAVARMGTSTTEVVTSAAPSAWSILLIDTVTNSTREIGLGVAPLFLDGTRLIYIRSSGIVSYDVVRGTEKLLSDHVFEPSGYGGFSSPDRLRIGWVDTTQKQVYLYKVDTGAAETVATVPVTDADISYALGDTGTYVLRKGREGQVEVWYGGYGAALALRMTLPAQLGITRLGIGGI